VLALSDPLKRAWRATGPSVCAALALVALAATARGGIGALGAWWDLIRIAMVFGLMVVLMRRGLDVGAAIFVGALALAALFPLLPDWREGRIPRREHPAVLAYRAFLLTIIVYQINLLGSLLAARNGLTRLIRALGHLVRDVRLVGAIIPSTIGTLPTPGGAMITAPLVKEIGATVQMDAETRVVCNYWFRHVWEFWWPLFPAVIYMFDPNELGLDAGAFIGRQLPLSAVAILAGYLLIIRRIPRADLPGEEVHPLVNAGVVARSLWPVALVAGAVTLAPKAWRYESFIGVLLAVNVALALTRRLPANEVLGFVRRACTAKMAFLIFTVYFIRGMFAATGAAVRLPDLLTGVLPEPVVCFIVPWIVGLLTGYTMAGVVTTFPLLAPMLIAEGSPVLPLVAVAYTGSFLGVMLSPTHLCLVLTREYFGADLRTVYRRLMPLYATVCAAIILLWFAAPA